MKTIGWLLLLVFANTIATAQTRREPQHTTIAFTHVAVVDAPNSSAQQDMTVMISGDRIVDAGKANEVKVPRSVQAIDGHGKFLIPGLWDMHVHTFNHNPTARSTNTWFFPLFIANGVTGVRDMWTTGEDFRQVTQFRKGLDDGSFVGPRYGAVGWLVDGPEPFWPYSDVVKTPQEARDFVHKAKAAGVDFVKVYWKLPPEEYFAIADESKKVGIPFAGHVPFVISAAEASDAGQMSIEHLTNVMQGCSSKEEDLLQSKTWGPQQVKEMLDTYAQQKCEQLLERFVRNQTWQVPTLSVYDVSSDLRLQYVPATLRAMRQQQPARQNDSAPERQDQRKRSQAQRSNTIAMMNKAGVPIMAGTDVASGRLFPGFSLHDELIALVHAGLTPGEALKTATYNPAKFLGMLDRLGTVEKGKLADLVLLDANPLEDIRNAQKIRAVVLNGRYLDRATLDKLLTQAEEDARKN